MDEEEEIWEEDDEDEEEFPQEVPSTDDAERLEWTRPPGWFI